MLSRWPAGQAWRAQLGAPHLHWTCAPPSAAPWAPAARCQAARPPSGAWQQVLLSGTLALTFPSDSIARPAGRSSRSAGRPAQALDWRVEPRVPVFLARCRVTHRRTPRRPAANGGGELDRRGRGDGSAAGPAGRRPSGECAAGWTRGAGRGARARGAGSGPPRVGANFRGGEGTRVRPPFHGPAVRIGGKFLRPGGGGPTRPRKAARCSPDPSHRGAAPSSAPCPGLGAGDVAARPFPAFWKAGCPGSGNVWGRKAHSSCAKAGCVLSPCQTRIGRLGPG